MLYANMSTIVVGHLGRWGGRCNGWLRSQSHFTLWFGEKMEFIQVGWGECKNTGESAFIPVCVSLALTRAASFVFALSQCSV